MLAQRAGGAGLREDAGQQPIGFVHVPHGHRRPGLAKAVDAGGHAGASRRVRGVLRQEVLQPGSVFAGRVAVGDHLLVSPDGIEVRVRSIHAQNEEAELGVAGQRCALNIAGSGLRKAQVHRGSWLLAPQIHDPVPRFDGRLRVLPGEAGALRHWTPVHLHLGAAEVPGRVAVLDGKSIAPGAEGLVQLVLDRRIGALTGDRFVVRDNSARRTVAGGVVLDPFAPARGRAKPERLAFLAAMDEGAPETALAKLAEAAPVSVDLAQFSTAWNLTPEDRGALIELSDLVVAGPPDKQVGLLPGRWRALAVEVLAALKSWHETQPGKSGPGTDALRKALATDRLDLPALEMSGRDFLRGLSKRIGLPVSIQRGLSTTRSIRVAAGRRVLVEPGER